MASRKDIEAGRAFMRLFLQDDMTKALKRTLDKAGDTVQQAGQEAQRVGLWVAGAGVAVLTPLIKTVTDFTSEGKGLSKLSKQLGETVPNLSRLKFAARETGVDFDDLTGAMEELNIRLGEADQDGTGPLVLAFEKLGLSVQKVIDLPFAERLRVISAALATLESNADRGFLADEIFGGDAFKILSLLDQGADGIDALADASDRLGLTMSAEQAQDAAELAATWRDLLNVGRGLAMEIGGALLPSVQELVSWFRKVVEPAREWIRENKELTTVLAAVAAGAVATGVALFGLGTAAIFVGGALTGLATIAGVLFTPGGLIIGGVAAVIAIAAAFVDWGAEIERIHGLWEDFAEFFGPNIAGIRDALMSGDLETAARIAFNGLLLAWNEITAQMELNWIDFKEAFLNTIDDMILNSGAMFTKLIKYLSGETTAWVKRAFQAQMGVVRMQKAVDMGDFDLAESIESVLFARIDLNEASLHERFQAAVGGTRDQRARDFDAQREAIRGRRDSERGRLDNERQLLALGIEGEPDDPFGMNQPREPGRVPDASGDDGGVPVIPSSVAVDANYFREGPTDTGMPIRPSGASGVTANAAAAMAAGFGAEQSPVVRKLDELKKGILDGNELIETTNQELTDLAAGFVYS